MESKKRLFIAFSITMILVVAIFTSLGRSILSLTTPHVVLPTLSSSTSNPLEYTGNSSLYQVTVTPHNVQSVIKSLVISQSYYRNLQTTLFWGTGDGQFTQTSAELWYHQGVSHVKKTLPSGEIRHDMIHEDSIYYWYEGEDTYLTKPSHLYGAEYAQSIPSYETVLDLDVSAIHVADFQTKEQIPCIYIEATPAPLFYTERYWVSVETGLLVAAETYEGDKLIYRMEGYTDPIYPLPRSASFTLPDGTLLIDHMEY